MKHLDLFSGIGGFALAASQVFEDHEVVAFCDNDKFCQAVLKKHWPNTKIYGDITDVRGEKADLITGGFPCQPFSFAGRKKGSADSRYLWPAMFRVVRDAHPTWVVAENVPGLLAWDEGKIFEQVCLDLEGEGYEVRSLIVPACAVGAPHRRDRVWIIGYAKHHGRDGTKNRKGSSSRDERNKKGKNKVRKPQRADSLWSATSDWEQDWHEVAAKLCRVDDGVSKELYRDQRIKALGNAIVPQVAIEIFKAIKEFK